MLRRLLPLKHPQQIPLPAAKSKALLQQLYRSGLLKRNAIYYHSGCHTACKPVMFDHGQCNATTVVSQGAAFLHRGFAVETQHSKGLSTSCDTSAQGLLQGLAPDAARGAQRRAARPHGQWLADARGRRRGTTWRPSRTCRGLRDAGRTEGRPSHGCSARRSSRSGPRRAACRRQQPLGARLHDAASCRAPW